MQTQLFGTGDAPPELPALSPMLELGAYEHLWMMPGTTYKRLARKFAAEEILPSQLVQVEDARRAARRAVELLHRSGVSRFGVRIHRDAEYPPKLRDAKHPIEFLYYQGWWDLAWASSVAVVGTRRPSRKGVQWARTLARDLVADGWVVVSGLAQGIDIAAHQAAIEADGATIAVLGTPLSDTYPKANRTLQEKIAHEFLVISQVPVLHYAEQSFRVNRKFFPERNLLMSALTEATIIVEAGETSGTLIQARGALEQGRKLLILDHCFQKPGLSWPGKLEQQGAIRVGSYDEIREILGQANQN